MIQIGGYGTYHDSDRLWMRFVQISFVLVSNKLSLVVIRTWPTQWAASSAPYDGSGAWTATRFYFNKFHHLFVPTFSFKLSSLI